jgi:hypothetical protein
MEMRWPRPAVRSEWSRVVFFNQAARLAATLRDGGFASRTERDPDGACARARKKFNRFSCRLIPLPR